jgi:hypothetical protein
MLIAVLILPLSILAIELIYAQVKYYPKIVEEINGLRGGETKPATKSPAGGALPKPIPKAHPGAAK